MIAYAITDPATLHFNKLEHDIKRFADKKADMILYRDTDNPDYIQCAQHFILLAKTFEKVLLHADYQLAKKLNADGIHLKSTQFSDIKKAKNLGLFVVVSTHTLKEALEAEVLGADMITYSPVFETPGKGEPVGVDMLREVASVLNIPVIALGGILSDAQIEACKMSGASGFASIRYFS